MALKLKARVAETSTSTGTGDITLAGAITGHSTFASRLSVADTTEVVIYAVDSNNVPTGEWEEVPVTYSATNTLTRGTPTASSNGDAAVNFGAGTKIVVMTPSADRLLRIPDTSVLGTILTGLSTAAGTVVTSAHTILQAIGFLQKQVSDNATAISGKQATLVSGTNIKSINGSSVLGSGDLTVSASPGGSTTQVQFNDAGAFGGDAGLTYNKTTKKLSADFLQFSAAGEINGGYGGNAFSVTQYGQVNAAGISGYSFVAGATNAFRADSAGFAITSGLLNLKSSFILGWSSTGNWWDSKVAGIERVANDILGINNGTAGTFRDLKLRNLIGTGNLATGIVSKTANYTATADDSTIQVDATSGAITITLPAVSGCAGRIYVIKKTDASGNAVTVDPNASETIDGATTASLASQYSTITIQANAAGTAWHKLSGV